MNHVIPAIALGASALWAAALLYDPAAQRGQRAGVATFPAAIAPDGALLDAYRDCAAAAERRILSQRDAVDCLDTYMRLKLSFLPDIDHATFLQLDPAARWEVNRRAYAAYVAWQARDQARQ